jgi:hypothetical protein
VAVVEQMLRSRRCSGLVVDTRDGRLFITRDTVIIETPAERATSATVGALRMRYDLAGSSADGWLSGVVMVRP